MKEKFKVYRDNRRYRSDGSCFIGALYEVSNFGNVRRNGIEYKQYYNGKGKYLYFPCGFTHRAVAELFVQNPENKPEVDHIDGNTLNNNANNLRWVTHKENINNPITIIKRQGENAPMYGKNPEDSMTLEAIKEKRRKMSERGKLRTGEKNPAYGRKWMSNGINKVYIKSEEFDYYINQGYHFGMK